MCDELKLYIASRVFVYVSCYGKVCEDPTRTTEGDRMCTPPPPSAYIGPLRSGAKLQTSKGRVGGDVHVRYTYTETRAWTRALTCNAYNMQSDASIVRLPCERICTRSPAHSTVGPPPADSLWWPIRAERNADQQLLLEATPYMRIT